jgi:hypothetical protein
LWQKSADVLGKKTEGLTRVRPNIDKFNLSTKEFFHNEVTDLHSIYELQPANQCKTLCFETLQTIDKFKLLFRNTYRRRYAENLLCKQNHFKLSTKIANNIDIKSLKRPANENTLAEVVQLIESDFSK